MLKLCVIFLFGILHLTLGQLSLLNPLNLLDNIPTLFTDKPPYTFIETAEKDGYATESYEAITEDGYILPIFRIVESANCTGPKRTPPVLLMHGLLLSADSYIDAGPGVAVGYLLADLCYDVWVGNERGNYYGRRNTELSYKDKEFWQFSVDEIGYYDIPATIDLVLNETGFEKLNYIGYSQGSGSFFIMCSERPGYCEKAQIEIGLAPATRHLNSRSPAFVAITELVNFFYKPLTELGIVEIFQRGAPFQEGVQALCTITGGAIVPVVCRSIAVDLPNDGSITPNTLSVARSHFPDGTSTKNMARYGQAQSQEEFLKFDYGAEKNLELYGRETPPAYNLSSVNVPVVILYGDNDGIVDVRDAQWLAQNLPNVLEMFNVQDPKWNHFDMMYSQYIPDRIFPKIIEYLNEYSEES